MRHPSIALIGGSGFIGSHLANVLVAADRTLKITDFGLVDVSRMALA